MMSTLTAIMACLFLGMTALIWSLMQVSLRGYERYETVFTDSAESKLEGLFLFFDTRKVFFINIGSLFVVPVFIYFLTWSLFYALLALSIVLAAPKLVFWFLEKKRRQLINQALPDALSQIAGGMRAGSTFLTSVDIMTQETKGPISQEFSLVMREQRVGITMEEALDNLGERVQSEEMDLVITATQIAREVGGNLSEIFERLSNTLRRKMEMEAKIDALTSQGKLQGWVVGLLPFAIIAALFAIEPVAIGPIFSSILGWGFLAVILVMEFLGGMMIRKIVNIDV